MEETYAEIAPVRPASNGVTAFSSIMRGLSFIFGLFFDFFFELFFDFFLRLAAVELLCNGLAFSLFRMRGFCLGFGLVGFWFVWGLVCSGFSLFSSRASLVPQSKTMIVF